MYARRRAAAALALAAASLTVGAETGSAASAPALRGVTTFTAHRNSVVTVTLPRAVRIATSNMFESDAFRITGRGRIVGAALVGGGDDRVVVTALAMTPCSSPGCTVTAPLQQSELVSVYGGHTRSRPEDPTKVYEIPAGRYQVHLFTDGAPVSVELKLPALRGRSVISPAAPHRAVVKNGEASLPTAAGVVSSGASAPASGPLTLMANVYQHRARPHAESIASICYYHDSTPPAGLVLPGCPGGGSAYLIHFGYLTLDYQGWGYGFALVEGEASSWYQGLYAAGVQGPTEIPATFFWSDLRS